MACKSWILLKGFGHNYSGVLSLEEANAAPKFRSKLRDKQWVQGRIAAKILASKALCERLKNIRIRSDRLGRPYLLVNGKPSKASVSISHCGKFTAAAISRHCRVGIDIERIRHLSKSMKRLVFGEKALGRNEAIMRWTVMEAVSKLKGRGLKAILYKERIKYEACTKKLKNHYVTLAWSNGRSPTNRRDRKPGIGACQGKLES